MGAMESGSRPLSDAVSRILILKALDRINDLAVEIAEDVIFLGSEETAALD